MSIRQVALVAAVAALVIVPASAASAVGSGAPQRSAIDASVDEPIAFTTTTSTITVGQPVTATLQLGDWWSETCVTTPTGDQCTDQPSVRVTLDGATVVPQLAIDAQTLQVAIYDGVQKLSVGTHTLEASCNAPFTCATTEPMRVTVQAAALSVDGRIETDEAHPTGAIVTALLTGDAIDQYLGCDCALDPAGTWSVKVVDAKGASVFSRTIPVAQGVGKDVSAYWNDVPRGGDFTATFSFVPAAASAARFTVSPDQITYASPTVVKPTDDSTPDPSAQVATAVAARTPTLPLWAVLVGGVAVLAGLIAIAVLVVRLASGPVLVLPREVLEPRADAADPESEERS